MNETYLLIGGNVGDRFENLRQARDLIASRAGSITKTSAIYETAAWGRQDQPSFLNQVLQIATGHQPLSLLRILLDIEQDMGRTRAEKYGPRTIDIDILMYGEQVIEAKELVVPHPQMHLRRFVLAPLAEIAPELIHPVLKKSIDELLLECPDRLAVKKL